MREHMMEEKKKKFHFGLQGKFALSLTLMICALLAAICAIIATQYRSKMEKQYSELVFNQATFAANIIDPERIRAYYETGEKDEYYEDIRTVLLREKQASGLRYFYVVVPEENVMVYIWDAGEEGEEGVCDLLDTDEYYGGGNELMHSAFSPNAEKHILITNNEEYGYLASAYVPILDANREPVALASVDISMDEIDHQINKMIVNTAFLALGILVVCAVGYYVCIRRIVIEPLNALARAARGFTSETERSGALMMDKLSIRSEDEIGDLYHALSSMEADINEYMTNLRSVTAEKERIGAELNVATQIQFSMLPKIFPEYSDREEFAIAASMDPAKEVGGDFYDFFMVDERHLAIVMADVSGKGVPAALFMVIGKTLIKDHTVPGRDLGEIFTEVNNLLCESNSEDMFITAFEAVLDLDTGEMRFVNAGHEMPFLAPAGGEYKPYKIRAGFVLAGMSGIKYKSGVLTLNDGDRFFQYTDGVTEATSATNELFGMERLEQVLTENTDKSPENLLPAVKERIDAFVGEAPQFDDISMLCLEFHKTR